MNGPHLLRYLAILFFCLTLGLLCACQPDDDDDSSDDDDDNDSDDDNDTGGDDDTDDDDSTDDDDDDDDDATPICPEIVDGGRAGKDGSWAALDSAGRTLVVTTKAGELVLFTSADGLTWTMQHIVGRCAGYLPQDPQIALAGDDTPHVVFFDENSEVLVHVWRDAESWEYESLNDYQCTGDFSLAVDADGAAHLAYYTKDGFYYATNHDGAWTNEMLASATYYQMKVASVALDANDDPRIAYLNLENAIVLATRSAKGWSQQTIDEQPHRAVTLGVDADGHNHLIASTYFEEHNYVHYFHDLTGAWSEYTLNDVSHGDLSPIVFADGKLHFSVIHSSIFLYVAWLLFELDTDGTIEWITGIDSAQSFKTAWTRSAAGVIHCLYTADHHNEDFLDLTNINGDWENLVVDETGAPNYSPAQTIDADGATHLLYYVDGDDLFYHAQRREAGWERQSLTDELLPSTLDLIAGADGKLYAAFRHETQPVVAVYDGNAWTYTTVDTIAQASDLSLALDNDGRLHLALCDTGNDLLLVLRQEGNSWTQQLSRNTECRYPRLLFDHNDAAHLWFVKNLNTYYVADALDSWQPNILQAGAHPTARPLLTSDGQVHLLIIGDGALRHFAGAPDAMQSEELVLLEDNMGFSPGFAADADDTLYVTAREDDHLALLSGAFGDWQTVTFPEWGEVEIYSTVSVDADGNCRLAWLADGALWFASLPCP